MGKKGKNSELFPQFRFLVVLLAFKETFTAREFIAASGLHSMTTYRYLKHAERLHLVERFGIHRFQVRSRKSEVGQVIRERVYRKTFRMVPLAPPTVL